MPSAVTRVHRLISRFFQQRISLALALPIVAGIFLLAFSSNNSRVPQDVVISEVMTSNASFFPDTDGDYPDWIEIWNPTNTPISLENYQFIHNKKDQWGFPAITLSPNQYLVIYASGKNRTDGELHTNFLLSRNGEAIELHRPSGVDRFEIPALPSNSSYGRQLNATHNLCYFAYPTPGVENVPECFPDNTLGAPMLSHTSGYFDQSFELQANTPIENSALYFTLDGSFPDPVANSASTQVYTGPILVTAPPEVTGPLSYTDTTITDSSMRYSEIFRTRPQTSSNIQPAVTIRIRSLYSAETSATFLIGQQHMRTLPVVSLLVNPAHLFDAESGIYVAGNTFTAWRNSSQFDSNKRWSTPANYSRTGRLWERPHVNNLYDAVRFQYCTVDTCDTPFNIGIRTHGNASLIQPMRSLRLYARNDYRTASFATDYFNQGYSGWSTLILRNGGNNQRGWSDRFHFNDMLFQSAMRDFEATTQAFLAVNVYINGEYWGIHQLGERYDEEFIAAKYGVKSDNVVIIDLNETVTAPSEIISHWEELIFQAATLPPTPDSQDIIESYMDIKSFFDYVIGHTYAGNTDWPANNTMMWRTISTDASMASALDDQKWRWMIMDLDRVGASSADPDVAASTLLTRIGPNSGHPQARLLHGLLRFPALRAQFFDRYQFHLNTTFLPDRMNGFLDALVVQVSDDMARHEQRWLPMGVNDKFMSWPERVQQMRDFITDRPEAVRAQLQEALRTW
jgi:hypothetical protein